MSQDQIKQKSIKRPRVSFTQKEDQIITFFVNIIGVNKWPTIAKFVKNRTAKQCRDRYMNYLKPGLCNIEWTQDEDELLIELYSKYGPKWSTINKNFNNRNQVSLKNRYIFLQKQINQVNKNDGNPIHFTNQNLGRNIKTNAARSKFTLPDITYNFQIENTNIETDTLKTKNDDFLTNLENIFDFPGEFDFNDEIDFN